MKASLQIIFSFNAKIEFVIINRPESSVSNIQFGTKLGAHSVQRFFVVLG